MLTPETPSLTSGDGDEIPFTTRRCSRRSLLIARTYTEGLVIDHPRHDESESDGDERGKNGESRSSHRAHLKGRFLLRQRCLSRSSKLLLELIR